LWKSDLANTGLAAALFDPSLQKPPAPAPVVVEPEEIAAAGFGEIIFPVDLAVPPAAGKNIGACEFVDASILGSHKEPTVFMRGTRLSGKQDRLGCDPAHQHFSSRAVLQSVQAVQIVSGKLDASQRFPGKSRFRKMAAL